MHLSFSFPLYFHFPFLFQLLSLFFSLRLLFPSEQRGFCTPRAPTSAPIREVDFFDVECRWQVIESRETSAFEGFFCGFLFSSASPLPFGVQAEFFPGELSRCFINVAIRGVPFVVVLRVLRYYRACRGSLSEQLSTSNELSNLLLGGKDRF